MAKRPPIRRAPASLHIAWGFAWALNKVADALDGWGRLTPDQTQFRSSIYELLDELRPDEDSLKLKPTNRQLAEKYAISPRTVTNWRKEDCPFADGQWRVLDWMAARRYVPARAKAKFSRQLGWRQGVERMDEPATTLPTAKQLLKAVKEAGF